MELSVFIWIALALFGAAAIIAVSYFMFRPQPQADLSPYLAQIERQQAELAGRLASLAESQEVGRSQLASNLNSRLDEVTQNVTQNLTENSTKTGKSLSDLSERLVLIDAAQKQISSLSGQVVGLQNILDNKQARGSWGETRLNDLVQDALPKDAYKFQHTLSNGKRADCLILLPDPPGPVVIDSKFPLEAFRAMRDAATDADKKAAMTRLNQDTLKHARDISERYILVGETADAALMFLPSESVFSELHLSLPETIQKCRDMRVYPVSPNTMWLTLNTVRAIMRDAEMHQQASLIQKEVRVLMEDINRLDTRVDSLRKHFTQAEKDIADIQTSSTKITSRGEKIVNAELEKVSAGEAEKILTPPPE